MKKSTLNIAIVSSLTFVIIFALIYGFLNVGRYPSLWWRYIKENNIEKMKTLISSKNINLEENIARYTPLLFACWCGKFDIAKMLIAAGANVNVTNDRITPLSVAAHAGSVELVKLLLEKGADPDFKTKTGGSPLCYSKNLEITKLLVEHGANVNFRHPTEGTTPLMKAIGSGDNLSAKYLIEHGADVHVKSMEGTALSIARKYGNVEMENILKHKLESEGKSAEEEKSQNRQSGASLAKEIKKQMYIYHDQINCNKDVMNPQVKADDVQKK